MNDQLLNMLPSNWRPPTEFPTIIGKADRIAFDLETYDPHLLENGPGALRNDGYVVGFSLATDDGFYGYYPLKHDGDNVENPDGCIRWLRDQMADDTPKVGANILYDIIWAKSDLEIDILGPKYDVQIAGPLLNENYQTYRLDALAERVLNENKNESLLYEVATQLFSIRPTARENTKEKQHAFVMKKIKGMMNQLPGRYVGPYGEKDADLPLRIFNIQEGQLKKEGLWDLFLIETELLDILLKMWLTGVPVNYDKGEQIRDQLRAEYDTTMRRLKRVCGLSIDVWASESIVQACEKLGYEYPRTGKGNPSFKAAWLESQDKDFFKLLVAARKLDRSGSVFIEKKILDLSVNGRIHPQFWQVKSDRGGTVSGRFASSNPNAQQFPARDKRLAKLVRSIIEPDKGCRYGVFDYSQQEPRTTVHYAYLCGFAGAAEARARFHDDPNTDFHQFTADMASIDRKPAKTINLGLTYGMGKGKLAAELGLSLRDAYDLFDRYHEALPFIKKLGDHAMRLAGQRGYIRTILGRRRRFNLYGPPRWKPGIVPKMYEDALKEFGIPVQRYFLHKALNSLVQGSSADMIKMAIILVYRELGKVPYMTIHDENDYPLANDKEAKMIHDIMTETVEKYLKLEVPLKVDVEIGPNWGECVECEYKNGIWVPKS